MKMKFSACFLVFAWLLFHWLTLHSFSNLLSLCLLQFHCLNLSKIHSVLNTELVFFSLESVCFFMSLVFANQARKYTKRTRECSRLLVRVNVLFWRNDSYTTKKRTKHQQHTKYYIIVILFVPISFGTHRTQKYENNERKILLMDVKNRIDAFSCIIRFLPLLSFSFRWACVSCGSMICAHI